MTHTAVCFAGDAATALKQFSGPASPPPHGLTARLYGMKNVYTGLIRACAAYNIANPALYALAMATFAGVIFLNGTECFVYKTARPKETLAAVVLPVLVLLWMGTQREYYMSV